MASGDSFHWADYVLFVATLALSAVIGVWAAVSGGGQKTTAKFLMGNRNLSFFPVTMSIFMSFISAILVLGNTAEMYLFGVQYYVSLIGSIFSYLYIASVLVPVFYELKLTSTFVYLEKRYESKAVRVLGNIFFILSFSTYMGIATFAPATALEGAIGFPIWASILIEGVLATFYTSIGGMKAVVWTDAIQGIIYLGGVITVLAVGISKVGGLGEVFDLASEGGRLDSFSFNMNPWGQRMTVWSNVIGSFVISLETIGVGQASVQRYCSLSTLKKARFSIVANAPALVIMYTLTCLIGLVVYAYYTQLGCDPLRDGTISDPNQLLSTFIMDVVDYPGVPGLFLAVLFAGALSTLSSGLSALATVTWKDILELRFQHVPEERKTRITKLLTLMYGVLSIGVAYAVQYLPVHVAQAASSLITAASSPLLGMFLMGLFFPWANKWGAMIGAAISSAFIYWISIGSSIEGPYISYLNTTVTNCSVNATIDAIPQDPDGFDLYTLGYQWYSPLAVAIVISLGLPISFLTGAMDPKTIDPRLISPFFDRVLPCLPKSLRRRLYCGVPHDRVDEFSDEAIGELTGQKKGTRGSQMYWISSYDAISIDDKVADGVANGHVRRSDDSHQDKPEIVTNPDIRDNIPEENLPPPDYDIVEETQTQSSAHGKDSRKSSPSSDSGRRPNSANWDQPETEVQYSPSYDSFGYHRRSSPREIYSWARDNTVFDDSEGAFRF